MSSSSKANAAAAKPAGVDWESLLRERWREIAAAAAFLLILAIPFVFRSEDEAAVAGKDGKVVILTPHNESIRREFGRAFSNYMRETRGLDVAVDWRSPGGTSEIDRIVKSDFRSAFQAYWEESRGGEGWSAVADSFNDRKLGLPDDPAMDDAAQRGRREFLQSGVGIGVDLFFGGGTYDFDVQAKAGHLVAKDASGKFGIGAITERHPDWFTEAVIPESVSGEPYYDPSKRWVGSALSTFGICFNTDSLERLGVERPPDEWADLADPIYFGQVGLADPTKSGSATKAFEMLIQQQMQIAVDKAVAAVDEAFPEPAAVEDPGDERAAEAAAEKRKQRAEKLAAAEAEGVAAGWDAAISMIQRIGANARYFTDASAKIPHEVAQGEVAAGMCIDFYGRTLNQATRGPDGKSRIHFIAPVGGTSTGVDPIGMFRGAPRPDLADAFIEFVLSKEGQQLWNFRPGTPGGPEYSALRRMPVRRDSYSAAALSMFTDPEVLPYHTADQFQYHPHWTGPAFSSIRFVIRVICLDAHEELQEAWQALAAHGFPPKATARFGNLSLVNYDAATGRFAEILRAKDPIQEVQLARNLGSLFRKQYSDAKAMAEAGL